MPFHLNDADDVKEVVNTIDESSTSVLCHACDDLEMRLLLEKLDLHIVVIYILNHVSVSCVANSVDM